MSPKAHPTKAKTGLRKSSSPKKRKAATADEEETAYAPEPKKVYDSDALDEDSSEDTKKRKRVRENKKTRSPRKKRREVDEDEEGDLQEGQEIVGVVVEAPKSGRVSPGEISQNTLNFLTKLKDPKCNDREWFKLHRALFLSAEGNNVDFSLEPVYRLAEKEWKDFIESFTDVLAEVDTQIPHLPPKDVIHRIYRDVRFSNDKTPYKRGFSASFSRSGRKGIFAGYHVSLKPGNESLIAAGSWCPGRSELATIRNNIKNDSRRLRQIISSPEFVKLFGEAKPHPKGETQNIFGREDELKVAPKGVGKDHKDIDLLKCRSFAVLHRFTDSEVLDPEFKQKLASVARVMQPFVHCLNDMMTIIGGTNNNDDEESGDGEQEEGDDDDDE
ncbi:uncharacterized protein LACBIDRAFT_314859 [Laccaria bicolor S238N-H82]|uniref:Predicted protein n=1 Tax=Laccaria bicolor (strain S238N-H82 / ATCC MYA-4686) TaxID=486041 RepID=B0DZD6_LACBS|nr:uncharacterized protein LACBIDRAFT_314859 [Laccaria bicolor S238N-H82]EDR00070.1 predicted protein [Laccaria bicolor S238N-H82]|eukprot:XP_001889276.1 predicted protein [Laccaria bicolor S238N-H82]